MNKKRLSLSVIVILFAMLLSQVWVSASPPEIRKWTARVARAWLEVDVDGEYDGYEITAHEYFSVNPGQPPIKFITMEVWKFLKFYSPDGRVEYRRVTPPHCIKELNPSEFKWGFGSCQLSTEAHGLPLTIEWDTDPPTDTWHMPHVWVLDHYAIVNGKGRGIVNGLPTFDASVVAYWGQDVLYGVGYVAHYSSIMIKPSVE